MLGRMKWFLKIFFVALCGLVAAAPKRKKQITEPEERLYSRACKRLKTNKQKVDEDLGDAITSLYKGNKLSAQDVGNLLDKADAAGVSFKNPMQNKRTASDGTEKPEMARDKNAARTMDRWLKRNSQWGNVYWAQVPIKKVSTWYQTQALFEWRNGSKLWSIDPLCPAWVGGISLFEPDVLASAPHLNPPFSPVQSGQVSTWYQTQALFEWRNGSKLWSIDPLCP